MVHQKNRRYAPVYLYDFLWQACHSQAIGDNPRTETSRLSAPSRPHGHRRRSRLMGAGKGLFFSYDRSLDYIAALPEARMAWRAAMSQPEGVAETGRREECAWEDMPVEVGG